jgi:hypothetical protein
VEKAVSAFGLDSGFAESLLGSLNIVPKYKYLFVPRCNPKMIIKNRLSFAGLEKTSPFVQLGQFWVVTNALNSVSFGEGALLTERI